MDRLSPMLVYVFMFTMARPAYTGGLKPKARPMPNKELGQKAGTQARMEGVALYA